jgi:peptidoglycan/xylan/chitin deacetylase (PgdA/CDA1 family)
MPDATTREAVFLNAAGLCSRSNAQQRAQLLQYAIRYFDPQPFPKESDLMMTWDDARSLINSGHIVGSHSMTHPNLAHIPAADGHAEMAESKRKLERELGSPVKHFAYPHPALNPQWNETTLRMTEELAYRTAVTTTSGAVRADTHPLAIPRTYVPREEAQFLWHIERTFLSRTNAAARNPGA